MSDYKEMYFTLFREIAKAISLLQAAQQRTEELYLAQAPAGILILLAPDKKAYPKNDKAQHPQE